ncbi:MAG: hypothetical protein RL427_1811 [Bacteroidota bacterium]
MSLIYTRFNFHKHTFCVWQEVGLATIAGIPISYTSASGSRYIFSKEGVYRISNHWGRAANCRWRLKVLEGYQNQQTKVGFAFWSDFYSNDDYSLLFYITVDFETNDIRYHHKDFALSQGNAILRNVVGTTKRIALIKQVLTTSDWAKYLSYESFDELRRLVVYDLITTEATFIQIKQKHHQN